MAARRVMIWFDREGDFLEVIFEQREGWFRETTDDRVMEKVDAEGNVIGFSVLRVSSLGGAPLEVTL
ncbi:MAG: hypothetical protein H6Q91_149 [Deltaproteobacteria bacterium]|jgi:hypothetical protein|nr:hypothetical protein [Deltaproteobacteria bacterium]